MVALMIKIFLIILAASFTVTTFLPVLKHKHWLVRAFEFPRLQTVGIILSWLLIATASGLINEKPVVYFTVLAVICLIYQLNWLVPYTKLKSVELKDTESSDDPEISLLLMNVLMSNHNSDAFLNLVEVFQPDLVITLESDLWWQNKLNTLKNYPHRVQRPMDNLYGMHLYSKRPLVSPHIDYLVDDDIPSICARVRLNDNLTVRLHAIHPKPPAPGESETSLERDIELIVLASTLKDSKEPIIVAGDFNDVPWSHSVRQFRKISGLLDPRVGRGFYNTFHTTRWYFRWPLDQFFTSSHFRVKLFKRLPHIGSDHYPLFLKLSVTPIADPEQLQETLIDDTEYTKQTMSTDKAVNSRKPSIH